MAGAELLVATASRFPVVWTTREFDRWFASLPATERASWTWARPVMRRVLDELLTKPLDHETLASATRDLLGVLIRALPLHWFIGESTPFVQAYELLRNQLPQLSDFLGPASRAQAELSIDILKLCTEATFNALAADPAGIAAAIAEIEQLRNNELDEFVAKEAETADVSALRAPILLCAAFEAADRRTSTERGRDLARAALLAAIDTGQNLQNRGLPIDLDPMEADEQRLDGLILSAAWVALCQRPHLAERIEQLHLRELWVPPIYAPPRSRLRRAIGTVGGVRFSPGEAVCLRSGECEEEWLSATPELVERALSLRGAAVEALVLRGMEGRLVRIDPPGRTVPDAATRTRDMFRDWDGVLRRLAQ